MERVIRQPWPRAGSTAGFTLMELIIAITVLVILSTLALPSFVQTIQNNRLSGQANELVAATQLARSEAIKRATDVTFCASDDGATCSGGFADGWIVLADPGGADEVVRVYPAPDGDFNFTSAGDSVTFTANGFADVAAEFELLMTLSGCTNDSARRIFVERTGRVSSRPEACP